MCVSEIMKKWGFDSTYIHAHLQTYIPTIYTHTYIHTYVLVCTHFYIVDDTTLTQTQTQTQTKTQSEIEIVLTFEPSLRHMPLISEFPRSAAILVIPYTQSAASIPPVPTR